MCAVPGDFVDTKLLINMAGGNGQLVARAYKRNPRIVTRFDDQPELLFITIQGIEREMNRVN